MPPTASFGFAVVMTPSPSLRRSSVDPGLAVPGFQNAVISSLPSQTTSEVMPVCLPAMPDDRQKAKGVSDLDGRALNSGPIPGLIERMRKCTLLHPIDDSTAP